jgi:hypothetical protein
MFICTLHRKDGELNNAKGHKVGKLAITEIVRLLVFVNHDTFIISFISSDIFINAFPIIFIALKIVNNQLTVNLYLKLKREYFSSLLTNKLF